MSKCYVKKATVSKDFKAAIAEQWDRQRQPIIDVLVDNLKYVENPHIWEILQRIVVGDDDPDDVAVDRVEAFFSTSERARMLPMFSEKDNDDDESC